jgi:C4-dicarboxylate-specific signal transduction histidine kinase
MSKSKPEKPNEIEFDSMVDLVMRHRILLVGPTETYAKQLEKILGEFGYDVAWEKNGHAALARLAIDGVSLVISELKVPELDGSELLGRMRDDQRFERTPFIFIAAPEEQEKLMSSAALQANDILSLPFRPQELRIRLQNLISLSEYERFLLDENRQLTLELLDKNRKLEENFASLQKAHAEMRALQAQLVQSAKMASLGILGTGLAHEINNPLAIIVGYNAQLLQVLKKGNLDKDQVTKVHDRISTSATRITKIIESLRRLSVKQAGPETFENVRIDDLLPLLSDFFAERASAKGIETKFDLHTVNARVNAEPALLRQTFLAIVSNALDAMENSPERRITISSRAKDDVVRVVITDTGTGIPAEIRDKIFDPFFTTKDPDKGTGLGLTMAYRAVREFGGDITVECPPTGGTRVIVSLPRVP